MKQIKYLVLLAAISFLAACSSTKVTSSWKSPDVTSGNLSIKKLWLLLYCRKKTGICKNLWKSNWLMNLNQKESMQFQHTNSYGPKYLPQDEHKAVNKLQESGVDGFLTIVLLDKNKEESYNPGYSQIEPVGYYRNWYGYYRTVYGRVYTPGYYSTQTKYYWESNLYNVPGEKLVYSAQSESFDPSSVNQLANDYSGKLINDMMKQGLVARK